MDAIETILQVISDFSFEIALLCAVVVVFL